MLRSAVAIPDSMRGVGAVAIEQKIEAIARLGAPPGDPPSGDLERLEILQCRRQAARPAPTPTVRIDGRSRRRARRRTRLMPISQ